MSSILPKEFMERFLTCAVCAGPFKDPKILPCHHTFCLRCLKDYLAKLEGEVLPCPLCRKELMVPKAGLEKLTHNFFFAEMLEYGEDEAVAPDEKSTGDVHTLCSVCGSKEASVYCEICEGGVYMCADCQASHDVFLPNKKHKIQDASEAMSRRGSSPKPQHLFCEKHENEKMLFYCIDDQTLACRNCIVTKHNKHQCVDVEDIAVIFHSDITSILESNIPEVHKARLRLIREFHQKCIKDKATIQDQVNQHADQLIAQFSCLVNEDRDLALLKIDAAYQTELKQAKMTIEMLEYSCTSADAATKFAKCLLEHGDATDIATNKVRLAEQFEVPENPTFHMILPTVKFTPGEKKMTQPTFGIIKEGLSVISPPKDLHSFETKIWILDSPIFMAVNENRELYIVDTRRREVSIFNQEGILWETMYGYMDAPKQPWGVACGVGGRVAVSDRDCNCVKVYDAVKKQCICRYGSHVLQSPGCVAFAPDGRLVVCDDANANVYIFSLTGDVVRQFLKVQVGVDKGPVETDPRVSNCFLAVSKSDVLVIGDNANDYAMSASTLMGDPKWHNNSKMKNPGTSYTIAINQWLTQNNISLLLQTKEQQKRGKTKMDKIERLYSSLKEQKHAHLDGRRVYAACADNNGDILVATSNGVVMIGPEGKVKKCVLKKEAAHTYMYFSEKYVPRAMTVDGDGNLIVLYQSGKVSIYKYLE